MVAANFANLLRAEPQRPAELKLLGRQRMTSKDVPTPPTTNKRSRRRDRPERRPADLDLCQADVGAVGDDVWRHVRGIEDVPTVGVRVHAARRHDCAVLAVVRPAERARVSFPSSSGSPGSPTLTCAFSVPIVISSRTSSSRPMLTPPPPPMSARICVVLGDHRVVGDEVELLLDRQRHPGDEERRRADRPIQLRADARRRAERRVDPQLGARSHHVEGEIAAGELKRKRAGRRVLEADAEHQERRRVGLRARAHLEARPGRRARRVASRPSRSDRAPRRSRGRSRARRRRAAGRHAAQHLLHAPLVRRGRADDRQERWRGSCDCRRAAPLLR